MEVAPWGELRLWGKKVVQEGIVDLNRGVGPGEFREARGLAGSDEFFLCPDVVGRRFCQEVGPVRILDFLYCFEVALSREAGETHLSPRTVLLRQSSGLCILLA